MTATSFQPEAPAVEVTDLTVSLVDTGAPVVEHVSFAIGEGELLGLVGESGSGKSTVGLAVLGYARRGLQITGGSVKLGAFELLSLEPKKLRRARGHVVAHVPQDPASSLNPALRIGSQLRDVLEVHREELGDIDIGDRVDELLEDVALPRT